MLLCRPDFLTRSLLELTTGAMRGRSYWTAAEREYLAMCTAQLHRCPFFGPSAWSLGQLHEPMVAARCGSRLTRLAEVAATRRRMISSC
jgi:hypothetical protein